MGDFEDFITAEMPLRPGIISLPSANSYPRFTGSARVVEERTAAQVLDDIEAVAKTGLTDWDEQTSVSTPASNKWKLYFKSTGLHYKSDGGFEMELATLSTTQTLTNKTLTTPKISQINDSNGNELLTLSSVASAVNYLDIENSATTAGVTISTDGSDTDIDLILDLKGDGIITSNNAMYLTSYLRLGDNNGSGSDANTIWVNKDGSSTWVNRCHGTTWVRPFFYLYKTAGTYASMSHLSDGDVIGEFRFQALKGSSSYPAVMLRGYADANHSSSSTAGRLELQTTLTSALALAMKVDRYGAVRFYDGVDIDDELNVDDYMRCLTAYIDGDDGGISGTLGLTNTTVADGSTAASLGNLPATYGNTTRSWIRVWIDDKTFVVRAWGQ